MKLLARLWITSEQPKEQYIPRVPTEVQRFPQLHKQEIVVNLKEEQEQEKLFLERKEKRKIIGSWNILDMINWYDRNKNRQARKSIEVDIPENDPSKHFRWDIERIVKQSQEEIDLERGKKYIANVDEVLSHK